MARKTTAEGWFRKLDGDRLEIFLKVENLGGGRQDTKIRASGTATFMNHLADEFESYTGQKVNAEWRTVTRAQIPGQIGFDLGEQMHELSSDATVLDDA